jgi:hypothetical protein
MKKRIICLAVSLMIFVFSPAHAFSLIVETDTDRPGCDYGNFVVPGANSASTFYPVRENACGLDPSCQAWNLDPRSGVPSSLSDWGLVERRTGRNTTLDCVIRRRMG